MDQQTAAWLTGQIDAIRRSAKSVVETVKFHDQQVDEELAKIEFICNRATDIICNGATDITAVNDDDELGGSDA